MSEADARIRESIRDDIDHLHHEREYLRGVFGVTDVRSVAAILLGMLECGERQRVLDATLFLVDAVTRNISPEFNAWLPQSAIFVALRTLLHGPDHSLRHNAIHAIGQMYYREYAPQLLDALPIYLERYPLESPGFFLELIWLSRTFRRRRWKHYEGVASSPDYLICWSLLEILGHEHSQPDERDPAGRRLERLYQQLAHDDHFPVAAEARYQLALLRHSWEGQSWPQDEYRRRKKQLQTAAPRLTFAGPSTGVSNYLHTAGTRDYDHAMLDQFVRYRLDHPVTTV